MTRVQIKHTINIIIFILCLPKYLMAQVEALGANPPQIKWQVIANEKSNIIFPVGLYPAASKIAAIEDFIAKNKTGSIGEKTLPINIVLHGRSFVSNGFVATVPFRSEFFGLPIQDWSVLGSLDWMNVLAIHEYRHVLQFSNTLYGFTKLGKIVGGQTAWSLMDILNVPNWFSEGDAVIAETVQSNAGRGRNANFFLEQRAQFFANKQFRYLKARNDSYRSNMPSHYPLGYTMTLYARKKYGNDIWKDILRKSSTYYFPLYPFSHTTKKTIGLNSRKLYKAAYADQKAEYLTMVEKQSLKQPESILTKDPRTITFYSWPYENNKGEEFFVKAAYNQISTLIRRDANGNEKNLRPMSVGPTSRVVYGNQKAVWLESQPNPRWSNLDNTKIVLYDLENDKTTYIAKNENNIAVAINKTDNGLLTVSYDSLFNYSLALIDLHDKSVSGLKNNLGYEIAYPNLGAEKAYYLVKKNDKINIVAHDLKTDSQLTLMDWVENAVSDLTLADNKLLFRADFTGVEQIYSLDLTKNAEISQLTTSPLGAAYPNINSKGEKLIYMDYRYKGYAPVVRPLNEVNAQSIQITAPNEMEAYRVVNSLSESDNILTQIPDKNYEPKAYKGFMKGLKFHSWGISPSVGSEQLLQSFETYLLADDILGNHSMMLDYGYNLNEKTNSGGLNYSFGGWYPKINAGINFRERCVENSRGILQNFNEYEATLGLGVPLRYVKGAFISNLNFSTSINQVRFITEGIRENLINPQVNYYDAGAGFSIRQRQAYQAMQSKWGFGVNTAFAKSLISGEAERVQFSADIMVPGIFKTHGLQFMYAYQDESLTNTYQLPDNFSYGRGYSGGGIKTGSRFTLNYKFPIVYPDLGISGIAFVKRVKGNLFYDNTLISNNTRSGYIASTGLELLFDTSIFNFVEIPLGLRIGYKLPSTLHNEAGLFTGFIFGQF